MSGYGVFVNSMGYHLKEASFGNAQVQGKLHVGGSNKTGVDIAYTSGSGLTITPYTSSDYVRGPCYYPTSTITTITYSDGTDTITAAGLLGGILKLTGQAGNAETLTMPTGAAMLAALPNLVVGTTITTHFITDAAGVVTFEAGATGSTNIGYADLVLVLKSHAIIVCVITNATTGAYSFFVTAGGVNA